jgi:hypothetical protein
MGSLVSGIYDLIEGDPTKQEQGQLGDLGTFSSSTGQGDVNAANSYYGGILSGDPAQIAKTLAPEISSGAQGLEQQKKTTAEFGNRGGGTNSSTQAGESQERGNIINLEGGLQAGAAGAEASLGTNLLGHATNNISQEAGLASANQARQTADVGGIATGAAQIASGFIDPAAAAAPGGVTTDMANAGAQSAISQGVPQATLDTFDPNYNPDLGGGV